MSSATPGNKFNFLNFYPFPKFKKQWEISVDVCSLSLTFPVHSSASVPFNQANPTVGQSKTPLMTAASMCF